MRLRERHIAVDKSILGIGYSDPRKAVFQHSVAATTAQLFGFFPMQQGSFAELTAFGIYAYNLGAPRLLWNHYTHRPFGGS